MSRFSEKFGPEYSEPKGYLVEPVDNSSYRHRFGGDSWKVVDDHPVEDEPALIMVLDMSDPKLAGLGINSCDEIPICSYINSDVWVAKQIFKINCGDRTASLVKKTSENITVQDDEDRLPVPLPEKSVTLTAMDASHYPIDEDHYWDNTDGFLGGQSFFRVAGSPLWLSDCETVTCSCDREMQFLMGIGYENRGGPFQYVDNTPFFLGESALYCFFCEDCMELKLISQSS